MIDPDETASEPTSASTADSGAATTDSSTDGATDANTLRVSIHVMETGLRFAVNVLSDIDLEWIDPDVFQRLVERVTWERLDQRVTLQTVATGAAEGEAMFLGTVTLRPDETVVDHTLRVLTLDDAWSGSASPMTDPTTETAIREMQDAALSRALIDDDYARQSPTVAGVLETARAEATDAASDGSGVTLVASLMSVSTLFTHRRLRESLRVSVHAFDDSAWYLSGAPARVDDDLVIADARLAVRRFDADPALVVALGDVSIERVTLGERASRPSVSSNDGRGRSGMGYL